MITRKIGKIVRGNATPAQLMLACLLGSTLGFMPGFAQAPGLILLLAVALIILNGNLAAAALIGAVAKLVSLLALPASFVIGRALLDGPAQPLFKTIINAPVLALFGFEYYATTGGLLLGIVFGLVAGVLVIKIVRGLRTAMALLTEGSERAQRWSNKWWARLAMFIFIGRAPKEGYGALLEKKGKVIRPIGVVFSVLTVVLLFLLQTTFAGPLVTAALRQGMEQANGATVDLESAAVSLAEGRMTITGLAMADPNALDTDLLRAAKIEADVSATDLLRKRLKLDRIVISDAVNGAKRTMPGRIVGNPPEPRPAVEPKEGEKTLEDYLRDPERWQKRLSQVRQWLECLSGPAEEAKADEEEAKGESLRERLEREAQTQGYARVMAGHLIEGAPRLTVGELLAEKVRTEAMKGESLDIVARNISTQPHLLPEAPSVTIQSSGDTLQIELELGAISASSGQNTVNFVYRGLPVDTIAENLDAGDTKPISGGTIDVALKGTIQTSGGTYIDMPLEVTLRDTTVSVSGAGSAPVEELALPLALRGPIDNPRILLDDAKFADALVAAGAAVLASEVRSRADGLLKDAVPELDLKEGIPEIDLKKGLPGFGDKDEDKKDDRDGADKTDDRREQAKDLAESLFGGKKKKKKP